MKYVLGYVLVLALLIVVKEPVKAPQTYEVSR